MTAEQDRSGLSLEEAGELIEEAIVTSAQRQLDIWRRVNLEVVAHALIFARVSNETSRFSTLWLKVWRKSKDRDPDSLPPELKVAMAMMPRDRQEAKVFDGTLRTLKPWESLRGLDFQLTLPPDFLDLFANAKERQEWERLRDEQSLSTDWNLTAYFLQQRSVTV